MDMRKALVSVIRSQEKFIESNLMGIAESEKVYISWEELSKMIRENINEEVPTDVNFDNKADKSWYQNTGVEMVVGIGMKIINKLKNDESFKSTHTDPMQRFSFLQKAVIEMASKEGVDLLPHVSVTMTSEEMVKKLEELAK